MNPAVLLAVCILIVAGAVSYRLVFSYSAEDDRLTLYTCQAQVLGTSDNRTGAVCTLVSKQFYNPAEGANP